MRMDNETLQRIFRKTNGRCHLTGQKLVFQNYGQFGFPGAWEIEHSIPVSRGGTDHINNLYPACISANRSKCDGTTRSVRSQNGLTRAPMSKTQQDQVRENNTWGGLAIGAAAGLPFGPIGVGVGALVGALFGSEARVE